MRVLVCGGRDFYDATGLYNVLDKLHKKHGFDVVIEGNARGADKMAGYWARRNKLDNIKFHADWSLGRGAGPARNQRMLDEGKPDLVVAFPGSKGTEDMVSRAKKAGVPVQRIGVINGKLGYSD